MIEIADATPEHLRWIEHRAALTLTRDARGVTALRDGAIIGVVAYDCWTLNAVEIHFAFESVAAIRALLVPGMEYPFVQAGREILFGLTPSHKTTALKWAKRFGFKEVGRIRDGWDRGDDLIISELRKTDWLKRSRRNHGPV